MTSPVKESTNRIGAGGVGSITIQLLRALTDLTVIATASRPETQDWVRRCGAHYVIDHHQPLAPRVAALRAARLCLKGSEQALNILNTIHGQGTGGR